MLVGMLRRPQQKSSRVRASVTVHLLLKCVCVCGGGGGGGGHMQLVTESGVSACAYGEYCM